MRAIKRWAAAVLVVFMLFMLWGSAGDYNPNLYDTERIMDIIEELSSKEYNGRMAGTPDGEKTERFVASKFKEIGLLPGGDDGTYYQQFYGVSGNASGLHILEVLDGQNVVKTYEYGEDYRSVTNLSHSGEVIAKAVQVDMESETLPRANGEIALVNTLYTQAGENRFKELYEAGYRGVIVARSNAGSRMKGQSGVMDNDVSSNLPRAAVTPDVYVEIMKFMEKGYRVHLRSAFEVKEFTANNVIGVLKANADTDRCLIISGHMDHLGPDPDGVFFPGALDNASGTACVIEIANALKSQDVKPNVNIVFIAFSGEEEMLYGSTHYVGNPVYPLSETRVINLDMVGAKSELPMTVAVSNMSRGRQGSDDFVNQFRGAADSLKSDYEVVDEDASDHFPFAMAGVPAVTIIDLEKVVYHVPEDTIDNIGAENLERDVSIVMEVIGRQAYTGSVEDSGVGMWIYIISAGAVIVIASGVVLLRKSRKVS